MRILQVTHRYLPESSGGTEVHVQLLAQALLGGLTAAILTFNAYTYYQAGAQTLFGISMLDVLTQYARDLVQITVLPGIYLVGGGLAGLIVGGILRLIFAGME